MKILYASLLLPLGCSTSTVFSQCVAGEVEVTVGITTDNYGFESYWQLVPGVNACGAGTIAEGGNPLVGCGGGGLQEGLPGGYGDNLTIVEGPWCLSEGELYTIYMVDDWGDGQAGVEVFVDGVSSSQFGTGEGPLSVYTFAAQGPVQLDMGVTALITGLFAKVDEVVKVRGTVKSFGVDAVTAFDISYTIDGGAPQVMSVSGVNMNAGDTYDFTHDLPWVPSAEGSAILNVIVSNINGQPDLNTFNDLLTSDHVISSARPDLAEDYLAAEPLVTVVADSDQDLLVPRDLDFHPEAGRNQLWLINKGLDGWPGGSTVTFYHPGEDDESFEWRQDVNAGHFMSLPTGIAMADNNNFATSPGVFDANHNGDTPFTGPSLWSADTAIYCRYYGGLGSHLDMLHRNPNSQGIAHDFWNRFWVVDGFTGDIVMNDFRADHGPGNDYHGNGLIRRYADFTIAKDPNDHIVSHDVMDKSSGWLYVVDHGGQRVLRMNVNSGSVTGAATQWDYEPVVEYSTVSGYEWEVIITEGLVEPAGIEIVGTHLYVSDHSNGDIVIYDVSGTTTELGRIHTDSPGLMGITAGPDGRIWGVNATTHQLLRIDPQEPTGLEEAGSATMRCWPNPADEHLYFSAPADMLDAEVFTLRDAAGRIVRRGGMNACIVSLPTTALPSGTYSLELRNGTTRSTTRVAIVH